jgi:hypothetical protein
MEEGMELTPEMLRALLLEYAGTEFGPAERERLLPLVEKQLAHLRELAALDLGGDDPRDLHYVTDRRLER